MSRLRQAASPYNRRRFARSGFTLIEMIVAVTMLAIIMGVSVGRISAIISRQRVNRAAIALSNDIESAFSLATRDRKPVRIAFDSTGLQFSVSDVATGTVFRRTSLANFNLQASNVSLSRQSVRIYPVGLATDSLSITIAATIGGTTYSQQVRMGRGGLVQIK
ncbi:MAG: prepilin-type N-terminal cleavage/methylation domain-containing protein [Gemmatimonadota bacterium]|nr:prepilin-type N-terminal cleavage/methylation domain-containing protein [Gemmatimonadota bacterium]MDE3127103.1 prepilin-type N-terminal cleavage/methylation domain-containing protein [Gemmatimonadota bacterium]MDE3173674.1 prepilin-type N-terminal cleavage/methylation domain-containing protein [Gemmatimonadota bacterium]MDE3215731.1 prepilin-type N-terminal cleavage/methylation domain-containing protein [Gemmatimonadota bacterium]